MRTSFACTLTALATGATLLALPSAARAAVDVPSSINAPPTGPGTPEQLNARGQGTALREGIEANVGIGTGFADTYGLGLEGRIGYTFRQGVYAGGNVQYYVGHSVNDQSAHAAFVGGELGYKFFPNDRVEIRPFVFAGPAFITQVAAAPVVESISTTGFALQPGVIAMYHFGDAFIGGDAHYMITPGPNTLGVFANGGFGF